MQLKIPVTSSRGAREQENITVNIIIEIIVNIIIYIMFNIMRVADIFIRDR